MGFADGATGGIHSIAREAIYGDSYSDTGSGYYWGGVAGGTVTAVATGASASVATRSGWFWGGAGTTAAGAEAAAIANGARTVGMTVGGKVALGVEQLMISRGYSYPTITKYVWKPTSWLFSLNARSFGGMSGPGGGVFYAVEKPLLTSRAYGLLSRIIPLSP
jgi:hypothetical protein